MKILVTADLHYNLRQYDWLVRNAARFDLVILAGDLLDAFSLVDAQVQIAVAGMYLKRLSGLTRVIAASGNHDLDGRGSDGERTARWMAKVRAAGVATDGDALSLEGTLFSVCPWWDGPLARERIGVQLERDAAVQKSRWIWVYHAPPAGSRISREFREFGEPELAQWIDQYRPDAVFCGHVHNAPFRHGGSWIDRRGATWVFNAGRQIGEVPTHIILNVEANDALWFSLEGPQTVRLDQPLAFPLAELTEPPEWLRALDPTNGPSPT
jgi:Icc-related predicted phosphoesterase